MKRLLRGNPNKKQSSMLNMTFMVIYQLTTALFGFILPSLVLHHYGAELHGYTTTVSTIMSYIALLNAGLAPAAIQALYKPLSSNDKVKMNGVLNAIERFYVISGCMYTIIVFGIAFVLPLIISSQIPSIVVTALMIVIGASNTLECFIYSKYRVLLQADQRLYIVAFADTVAYFIRVAMQVGLIILKANIILVMAIPTLLIVLRMMILSYSCKIIYGVFDKKIKPDNSSLSKRWPAMIHQISTLVVNNSDVVLLTFFGDLVQVSIYSVYNLIFNHINILFSSVFSSATVASFGRLLQEKKQEVLNKIYDLYEYGYYLVVAFVYGVAASMILPFISLYTKGIENIQYTNEKIAILFIIIGLTNHLRMPGITLITAAGHFNETKWRAIFEATMNLSISLLLVNSMGMYGVLLGTICSFAYRTIDVIHYTHKHILTKSCRKTIFRIVKVVIITLLSIFFYKLIFDIYYAASWLQWVKLAFFNSIFTILIDIILNFITESGCFISCIRLLLSKNKQN